jgi:hypothetical protein
VATVTITITGVTAATANAEGEGSAVHRAAAEPDERTPWDATVRERAIAALVDESPLRIDELEGILADIGIDVGRQPR